jgi:hypothetical protein
VDGAKVCHVRGRITRRAENAKTGVKLATQLAAVMVKALVGRRKQRTRFL